MGWKSRGKRRESSESGIGGVRVSWKPRGNELNNLTEQNEGMKRVSSNVCSRKCFRKFREWGIPLPFHFIPRLFVRAFPPHLRHAKKKHPSGRRRKIISALTFDRNSTFFLSLYVPREDFFGPPPSLKILSTILFDATRVWHCGFEGTTMDTERRCKTHRIQHEI